VQSALRREGLAGLLPKKRGPKGARKLRGEVLEFLVRASHAPDASATRTSVDLARQVQERFDIRVHPRSIERALARQEKKLR
jgi:hypothetical protein